MFRNKLLQKIPATLMEQISDHIEPFDLVLRDVVVRANRQIEHIYFPETGQISAIVKAATAGAIEVGMIGFEGMSDLAPGGRSPIELVVQVPGRALRMPFAVMMNFARREPVVAELIWRYQRFYLSQVSYTALSHGCYTIDERLARWLLMLHDRVGSDEIPLVHEFLSWMLGVRRAGVSQSLGALQAHGAISTGRGRIRIVDREILTRLAAGSYGQAEAEYARLIDHWTP